MQVSGMPILRRMLMPQCLILQAGAALFGKHMDTLPFTFLLTKTK